MGARATMVRQPVTDEECAKATIFVAQGSSFEGAGNLLGRSNPKDFARRAVSRCLGMRLVPGRGPTAAHFGPDWKREALVAEYVLLRPRFRDLEIKWGLRSANGMTAWRVVMQTLEKETGIRFSRAELAGRRGKKMLRIASESILARVWRRHALAPLDQAN